MPVPVATSRRRSSREAPIVSTDVVGDPASCVFDAGLTERGLITEAGREDGAHGGAVKYKTTPLFERVFGLESLSQLPRLDDLPGDVDDLRERLHAVAEQRSA